MVFTVSLVSAVAAFNSRRFVQPATSVSVELNVSLPTASPGLRIAPASMVVAPLMMPEPPSVAPLRTATVPEPVPLPVVLLMNNEPLLTIVPPLNVLSPLKVNLPVPILCNTTRLAVTTAVLLLITPLKVESTFAPPI